MPPAPPTPLPTASSAVAYSPKLPRVLVTGFGAFPGAPVNPTEQLIPLILQDWQSGRYDGMCELVAEVLPVEYEKVPLELARLSSTITRSRGEDRGGNGELQSAENYEEGEGGAVSWREHGTNAVDDSTRRGNDDGDNRQGEAANQSIDDTRVGVDIAIHFGLHGSSSSITLEHLARNACRASPDAAGLCPTSPCILLGGSDTLPSTLPLSGISRALTHAGIPHTSSDDAGGYLCNFIFYLGRAGMVPGFKPEISGFVHVPPLGEMGLEEIGRAARVVIEESCELWQRQRGRGNGSGARVGEDDANASVTRALREAE